MTLLRALMFTLLVPCTVAIFIPMFAMPAETNFTFSGSILIGMGLMLTGGLGYVSTLFSFLLEGKGTPAVWFSKRMSFLIGEEPGRTVKSGLYRYSRNPMYLSVFLFVMGMGFYRQNYLILIYGVFVFILFHLAVIFVEEPHLKRKFGDSYKEYFIRTRRWL